MFSTAFQNQSTPCVSSIGATRLTAPQSLLDLVGDTPLLDLSAIAAAHGVPASVKLMAKAEWYNPGGSVKDRPVRNMILSAEARGELRPGMTIMESTSGNTGIAFAMLGAARGYKVRLVVPESLTPERLAIVRAYGAEVVFTPAEEGIDGALREVRRMADNDSSLFYANQYDNPDNWRAHYLTTANEIWAQTHGEITHFITGVGTSGTFTGTTRRLKELNEAIECISVQPAAADTGVEGLKHMATAIVPAIYDPAVADTNVTVTKEEAHDMARYLARHAGIFVGVSAGASVAAAINLGRDLTSGTIVTVLPDSGMKYLSDPFWNEGKAVNS